MDTPSPLRVEPPTPVQASTPVQPKVALCLSGGGYRAMLFHAGALLRLNECGLLPKLDLVSSVSGGSIASGVLWHRWPRLEFAGATGVAANIDQEFIEPIRRIARTTIDIPAILISLTGIRASAVAASYYSRLIADVELKDLPAAPEFVVNSTNYQSGALWRFTQKFTWDYRVGEITPPRATLARAIAASAAFPPFLSPASFRFKDTDYTPSTGTDLQRPPFTTRVFLGDGGVYDNLGLEPAKHCDTLLVSDGGGRFTPGSNFSSFWPLMLYSAFNVIDNQVRALRVRQLLEDYTSVRKTGTYWGIWSDIAHYKLPDTLPCPFERTTALAKTGTRLYRFSKELQERLMNWGYAICDAALRKYYICGAEAPQRFPYPIGV